MKLKYGVISVGIDYHIWYALGVADAIHKDIFNTELVVTSLKDGKHKDGSLHYEGKAADLRTKDMTTVQVDNFYVALKEKLDPLGFDTVKESDHIHTEWDPKKDETFFTLTD